MKSTLTRLSLALGIATLPLIAVLHRPHNVLAFQAGPGEPPPTCPKVKNCSLVPGPIVPPTPTVPKIRKQHS